MKPSRHKIARYISSQSLDGKISKKQIKEFAAYLIDNGRTNELTSILRDVDEIWAEHGVIEVQTYSAHKLSLELRSEIKRIIKKYYPRAKRIEIYEQAEPALIGGVRLEFANQQLDLSIKSELEIFKQAAMAGQDQT